LRWQLFYRLVEVSKFSPEPSFGKPPRNRLVACAILGHRHPPLLYSPLKSLSGIGAREGQLRRSVDLFVLLHISHSFTPKLAAKDSRSNAKGRGSQMYQVLSDSLLIFGSLAILLAPMALALANAGPGGAGWKLLTFLCCTFTAWSFFFTSSLLIALVAAWACAVAMRMSFNRRRA
jgi:hypothetical protein